MNCDQLFYSTDVMIESLHDRTQLASVILDEGIAKKNMLIEFLRGELSPMFGTDVKFWLQGSYKSFTLIKPVSKYATYDIDVGSYLLLDAEDEGIDAIDVKDSLRAALNSFCAIHGDAQLQESKNACEGIKFSSHLTIDTPIYYKSETVVKLATNKGWVDSDPKAIQEWLTNRYDNKDDRALMKRIVRYVKAWVNVQWQGSVHKKIPSLAINVLVALYMVKQDREDDSFIHTCLNICRGLDECFRVDNPLTNDNLLTMSADDVAFAYKQISALKSACETAIEMNETQRCIVFSNIFQHYFPQINFPVVHTKVGLPALTYPLQVSVCRYNKSGVHIETTVSGNISVHKGDSLTFTVCNINDYPSDSDVYWTVRNVGSQATDANDIGHRVIDSLYKSHKRDTAYMGKHTMECIVINKGIIIGAHVVHVDVKPERLIPRNTKRRIWR
ncbi:nucleotide-binding domain-containing protein [Plesiomonas shigelloides]|uniref:nucleotide-binding domain-containing protein n=1 Tax=Plesiomonas shigelloides TaxID=703 RepID=UPI0031B77DCF